MVCRHIHINWVGVACLCTHSFWTLLVCNVAYPKLIGVCHLEHQSKWCVSRCTPNKLGCREKAHLFGVLEVNFWCAFRLTLFKASLPSLDQDGVMKLGPVWEILLQKTHCKYSNFNKKHLILHYQ
jgi:hypothetical protein